MWFAIEDPEPVGHAFVTEPETERSYDFVTTTRVGIEKKDGDLACSVDVWFHVEYKDDNGDVVWDQWFWDLTSDYQNTLESEDYADTPTEPADIDQDVEVHLVLSDPIISVVDEDLDVFISVWAEDDNGNFYAWHTDHKLGELTLTQIPMFASSDQTIRDLGGPLWEAGTTSIDLTPEKDADYSPAPPAKFVNHKAVFSFNVGQESVTHKWEYRVFIDNFSTGDVVWESETKEITLDPGEGADRTIEQGLLMNKGLYTVHAILVLKEIGGVPVPPAGNGEWESNGYSVGFPPDPDP